MTIIRPNSITGVTSITALADDLNFYRSDGSLQPVITANINSTGVSTFATANITQSNPTNLNVSGVTTVAAGSTAAPSITPTGDSDTGIFFPSADTIAIAEGGSEALRIDSSSNLQFNSGYGSVATAYGCRAWVNFNGTSTVAIRASGNVSSITDNGTGDYTVNFTTAMPDADYGFIGTGRGNNAVSLVMGNHDNVTQTSSALRIYNLIANFAPADPTVTNVAIFR